MNNEADLNKDFASPLKLFKHIDRLNEWDKKGDAYPIQADLDLTMVCNNKCSLCIGTGLGKNYSSIPFEKVKDIIHQLNELGVKSFGLGGGGEPSCHPNFAEVIRLIDHLGLDSGVCTNGYVLSDDVIDAIINCCTYLKISLDADGPDIYKKTHGMDEKAFYAVIANIKKLVSLKQKLKKDIVIGSNYLVGPDTISGIYNAAKLSKELGLNYIRIRPFFDNSGVSNITKEEGKAMNDQLSKCFGLQDDSFSVPVSSNRWDRMFKGKRKRPYKKCYSHHFVTLIGANQKLYPCCHLSYNEKYCYGDLKKNSFKEIWNSKRRKEVYESIDFKDCPNPCRLDAHNKLLWDIKQPIQHPNFL
ncbi:hypothetical protein CMO93_04665 [Candidatus Woesearchaeota archaeon]|nr:hypothetical protein [Candidatus Woesearchaeota archaeon]|tara:strand:- start:1454 stop:2527 length:1074 start_codon:yes stop_codon:yes gene_type:complete